MCRCPGNLQTKLGHRSGRRGDDPAVLSVAGKTNDDRADPGAGQLTARRQGPAGKRWHGGGCHIDHDLGIEPMSAQTLLRE